MTAVFGTVPKENRPQWAIVFLEALGWERHQACAIVAQGMWESGGNHKNDIITEARGDHGSAHGGWQWRGDRYVSLLKFATDRGKSSSDLEAQLLFVDYELRTSERRAGGLLREATDVEQATAAFIGYLRPVGFTWDDPRKGHGFSFRLKLAEELYASA